MPNGPVNSAHTVDSTSASLPGLAVSPVNFRDVEQRMVQRSVDKLGDQVQGFSVGNYDGRFFNNFPGTTQDMENDNGYFYHVIGVSVGLDMSVVAP